MVYEGSRIVCDILEKGCKSWSMMGKWSLIINGLGPSFATIVCLFVKQCIVSPPSDPGKRDIFKKIIYI
jgi:hypothetical protein